ncbi:MAG: bifunctional oligoribonuclease/PAP phosphatase NrnA [Clostridia bacterium]|nr:bifunctional oligoribonuclease/PAP phosphatase NrnA [Clostridia bacterium]
MESKGRFITLFETAEFLSGKDNFLILTHQNPDGDTLGSGFGLAMILDKLGKKSTVICSDEIPKKYEYFTSLAPQNADLQKALTVIAVDVADTKLLGDLEEKYADKVELCIDHHVSNVGYAKATYLDGSAAANCECIYELAKLLGVEVDANMALALYTGISTDTGCFRFSNTTAKTHRIGADLIELGIDSAEINRVMFETKSRIRVELERMALDAMQFHFNNRCAVIVITREMYEKTGCKDEDLEGITAIPRSIEGVIVGVTLREREQGGFKISVRTYPPVDASAICKRVGGGGHIRAAGCQLGAEYSTEDAVKEMLKHVKAVMEESFAGTVTDK